MSFTIDEERRPLKAAEETKIMVSRQTLTALTDGQTHNSNNKQHFSWYT